jgi:hypothetical protein
MVKFEEYLIEVKPLQLRDDAGWTTHFVIYKDSRSSIDVVKKVEMGNISASADQASQLGIDEAKRLIRQL